MFTNMAREKQRRCGDERESYDTTQNIKGSTIIENYGIFQQLTYFKATLNYTRLVS